jgi:hypothetical protein
MVSFVTPMRCSVAYCSFVLIPEHSFSAPTTTVCITAKIMSNHPSILIIGANGQTGVAVARTLANASSNVAADQDKSRKPAVVPKASPSPESKRKRSAKTKTCHVCARSFNH